MNYEISALNGEVIVLTFTTSPDNQPAVKMERQRTNTLKKSRISHVEKSEDVVVYKPDGNELKSTNPAPVSMLFTMIYSHKYMKEKKWKCYRKLQIWFPETSEYEHYKGNSLKIFDNILEKMPGNYSGYILTIIREMQRNPLIEKILSTVTMPEGFQEDETDYYEPVVVRQDEVISDDVISDDVIQKEVINPVRAAPPLFAEEQIVIKEPIEPLKTEKNTLRDRFKATILWVARKQRILQILEHAFPNHLSLKDILRICDEETGKRLCSTFESNHLTVVVILKELEKKGLIKELEKGRFMRIPKGTTHEVKIVRQLPMFSRPEQPSIAIITAMYCEKLAVDAMMGRKVSYIRYKAEGDTHIYTVGTIGKHKVVVTKLAQVGSEGSANISAENAVTRLLGTFNRVEHVFLVGVAGGIPNSEQVRLGDIVVSAPASGPLYIVGERVHMEERMEEVDVRTKAWHANDRTLQKLNKRVQNELEQGSKELKPWTQYLESGLEAIQQSELNFINFNKPVSPAAGMSSVHFGAIGSGQALMVNDQVRLKFAETRGIKAFDHHFEAVLKSFEGSRQDSFYIIRGISDMADGWEQTRLEGQPKWQPYASMVAAAYMTALLMSLPATI